MSLAAGQPADAGAAAILINNGGAGGEIRRATEVDGAREGVHCDTRIESVAELHGGRSGRDDAIKAAANQSPDTCAAVGKIRYLFTCCQIVRVAEVDHAG